ncbi:hypothetical protein ACH0BZ_04865 [Dietzia sp. 179-F 9C3 NHS]
MSTAEGTAVGPPASNSIGWFPFTGEHSRPEQSALTATLRVLLFGARDDSPGPASEANTPGGRRQHARRRHRPAALGG